MNRIIVFFAFLATITSALRVPTILLPQSGLIASKTITATTSTTKTTVAAKTTPTTRLNLMMMRGGAAPLSAFPQILKIAPPLALKTLTGLSFLTTSIGLNRFYYFFSLGYGLTMACLGAAALILATGTGSIASRLHCAGFVVYGARLYTFLVMRNRSVASKREQVDEMEKKTSIKAKLSFWPFAALLYPCMFSPALFHHLSATAETVAAPIFSKVVNCIGGSGLVTSLGLSIFAAGIIIESIADQQKSAAKKISSGFVNLGVWRYSRHANYAGEIMVYVGSLVAALPHYSKWSSFGISVFGTVGILNTMLGATERLDKKQAEAYGDDAAYKAYVASSAKLFI